MRAIVTGGAGFIGSNLALELQERHDVVVVDNLFSGNKSNLDGFEGEFVQADICSVDWAALGPDAVFHLAAVTDTRIKDAGLMARVNFEASRRLFEFASSRGIPVVYASSAAVYGNGQSPMKIGQPLNPLNPYGKSKLEMEKCAENLPGGSLRVGLRYFNVFGPHEQFKNGFASMIWQLSRQMLGGKRPRIFKHGEQTRDHVYVKDVVQATIRALDAKENCVLNVGTGKETSFNQIIAFLNKALGLDFEPEYIVNPYDFYQTRTCADIGLTREKIGYSPQYSVESGIRDYLGGQNQFFGAG